MGSYHLECHSKSSVRAGAVASQNESCEIDENELFVRFLPLELYVIIPVKLEMMWENRSCINYQL